MWSYLGDKVRLTADTDRARTLARELGQPLLEFVVEFNLGESLLLLDDPAAAELHIKRAMDLDRRLSGAEIRPVTALLDARLRFYRQEEPRVRAILAWIREREIEVASRLVPAEEVVWSMLDLATRDAGDAVWNELEARGRLHVQGYEWIEIVETRALAAQRQGRPEEARHHLLRAIDMAARIPNAMSARLQRRLRELG